MLERPVVAASCKALLLLSAAASAHAGTWSNLWFTPEQQGQRELEAGHASEAARMFTDPRRRAYAELKAENYEAAQKQLEPLSDAESQYNRGNALARTGNLRAALDAYDASLKHTDKDAALRRDAQHNRDLVAKQLEKQSRQQQGGQGQSGSPQGDKSRKDQAGQGEQNGQPQNGQPQNGQQNQPPDSKESAQSNPGNQGQSRQANQSQGAGSRQNGQQQSPGSQNGQGEDQNGQSRDQEESKADAQQAQRDAAQALQQSRRSAQNPTKTTAGDAEKGRAQSEPAQPPTEQTLALDQWLRQIPDDPGGLLRRKFLIEHMIKQDAGGTRP
jgi:Ca-activated chloride channel homolog